MYDFSSLFNFLGYIAQGGNPSDLRGETVGRDEFYSHSRNILIDTCFTLDTHKYETGVKVNSDPCIVVEEYETREEAELGHKKYINICSKKKFNLISVQIPEVYIYE